MVTDTRRALALAREVIAVQGSIFIRELLRKKKASHPDVRIGVKKEEVLENLNTAIAAGWIGYEDLQDWAQEVEGWGKQHVYLFKVQLPSSKQIPWGDQMTLRSQAEKMGAEWGCPARVAFPRELKLSAVAVGGNDVQVLWHQRAETWHREPDRDPNPEEIEGDLFEFRAFRQILSRTVMRFVLQNRPRRAALFVQIPLGEAHRLARGEADVTVRRLFPGIAMMPVEIATAIKALDQRDLDQASSPVRAQSTKFFAKGATVEFDADPTIGAWKSVESVRRVRQSLRTRDFEGYSGKFQVSLHARKGMKRTVMMALSGRHRRIYCPSQMTEDEMWSIVELVYDCAR